MRPERLKGVFKATSFWDRMMGLMGCVRWPRERPFLFFPECGSVHTFFTFLRPDIVFTDKNNKILRVVAGAGPWRFFWGPRGTRHCLEAPRGTARAHGWKSGKTRLEILTIN